MNFNTTRKLFYKSLPKHAGLYSYHNENHPVSTPQSNTVAHPQNGLPRVKSPIYIFIFDSFNNLIDDTYDDQHIQQRLWQDRQHKANIIIHQNQPKANLAKFLHTVCYSLAKSTLLKAINKNHFTTWLGMMSDLITKHLPYSEATIKGHLTPYSRTTEYAEY